MAKNHLIGFFVAVTLGLHSVLYGEVQADGGGSTFTVSSFSYPQTRLNPYDWRYLRVDLPPWFSSISITIESDVYIDLKNIGKASRSTLPIICFREGSPPLPDVYNTSQTGLVLDSVSNATFGGIKGLQIAEQCFPLQKIISVTLTNEQISSGVWYLGLFNGIGSMRTQSKMINRGRSYSFMGNVSVEGCIASSVSGQFCNETVNLLTCAADSPNITQGNFDNHTSTNMAENAVCRNDNEGYCQSDNRLKIFSLILVGFSEEVMFKISNITFSQPKGSNSSVNASGIRFKCYARHGAIPLDTLHDFSVNISESPLIISVPKAGLWYITIQPINLPIGEVCYSLQWQVLQCPADKAGPNCTWNNYLLQTFVRKSGAAFESYYLPSNQKMYSDSANFPLEPLLSNSSYEGRSNSSAWTFFLVNIPFGAAGGNLHIHLASDEKLNYEIYARYGGFPSLENWDYFCKNSTSCSNDSMFFKMYDSGEKSISFYILYAREGTWGFGLKHLAVAGRESVSQTTMTISTESCPQKCSAPHGACKSTLDTSGLTLYSYCACDRNHGGFDCSVELVSRKGHLWQSVSLIASNAAAVLPAYWALRHKAFAEWVLFTSSGISSGLYHACDVGTWCPLTFHVLQFMDFWLSFMAVVSTFVYLAAIDETSKRTIHTIVAIVTALMAETGPTRSSNIVLVLAIGTTGLVVGWLIELFAHSRSISRSWSWTWMNELRLNMPERWIALRDWMRKLIKTFLKRFRWGFVVAGFIALAMAGVSWTLETSQSYWIWHSMWHVSIYTSSFLFLCSKAVVVSCDDETVSDARYVLTRQNSAPRDQQRDSV